MKFNWKNFIILFIVASICGVISSMLGLGFLITILIGGFIGWYWEDITGLKIIEYEED